MNTIKELIALHEANPSNENIPAKGPVDIKDVVKYFPSQHQKAIKAFSKQGRLEFGGMQLFSGDEDGEGMREAISAAEEILKDDPVDVRIGVSAAGTRFKGQTVEEFEFDADISDTNQVWVGYDTQSNELMIGFDCWLREDDFNDKWDNYFESQFDEDFDEDDPDHDKILNQAWREYRDNFMMVGMLVLVNDKFHARIEDMPGHKGFFRGIHKMVKGQKGVIEF